MQSVTGQFDRLVRALERLGQVVAILAFAAIVLVTTVDVAMRYLLNSLREAFDMPGVPIRLSLRKSKNPFESR